MNRMRAEVLRKSCAQCMHSTYMGNVWAVRKHDEGKELDRLGEIRRDEGAAGVNPGMCEFVGAK